MPCNMGSLILRLTLAGFSIAFQVFLALLMIIPGDIGGLIDFFSFTAWLFYCLTFTTVILFRFRTRWRHVHRAYKVEGLNKQVHKRNTKRISELMAKNR